MRFWVYDEEGRLFRKFAYLDQAKNFLQVGWKLVIQPKPIVKKPTVEEFGEALF